MCRRAHGGSIREGIDCGFGRWDEFGGCEAGQAVAQ
jgi:hypothetical protein